MATDEDIFEQSGPVHLTTVDWCNPHHQRSVAACLVQGVYVQENDRQKKRSKPESLAPKWWRFFNFDLHEVLVDDADSSIFGAIYESEGTRNGSPRFAIVFRGTVFKSDSYRRDVKLDIKVIRSVLHQTSRYRIAMQAARNLVRGCSGSSTKIWLAGHSLGSSLATLVGKNMFAKEGVHLDSFLFNPPFASVPFEKLKAGKELLRGARSLITGAMAMTMREACRNSESLFLASASWVPSLFVNSKDPICTEYQGYFEHRELMTKYGAGGVEKVATHNSIPALVQNMFGKDAYPSHLLASGNLVVHNDSREIGRAHRTLERLKHPRRCFLRPKWESFRRAHGICQWWRTDLPLQTDLYKYKGFGGFHKLQHQ